MINLDRIINGIKDFPTLPTIYSNMMDIISNPRSVAADLAYLISEDQAAASKVLKVANSSFYGFQGRINSITQAIAYIGFEETKNLVIALSIIDMFKFKNSATFLNPVTLWQQSIAVGVINRIIGKYVNFIDVEDYFLGGILHQIGKLVFLKVIPKEYATVIRFSIENNISIRNAEQEILGVSNVVAGEMIAEKWKLPIAIREVITNHSYGYSDSEYRNIIVSTHLSRIVAMILGIGFEYNELIPRPNPKIWDIVKLPKNFFYSNLNRINNDYGQIANALLRY